MHVLCGVDWLNYAIACPPATWPVTAATTANTVGSYHLTDSGGTVLTPTASANIGLAKISDDGSTLTFPTSDVTAFVIEYLPRAAVAMTSLPAGSGIGTTP